MSRRGESILIFSRIPYPGQTKTRLIPQLGGWRAAKLHERLLARTLSVAMASGAKVELHCTGRGRGKQQKVRQLLAGHDVRVVPQRGDDLGQRMLHAICQGLRRGRRVILVGTDVPVLRSRDFEYAFRALRSGRDCAISPTEDGGYALIAMRRSIPAAFQGIPWSQPDVYRRTAAVLNVLGLSWRELPLLWDVDTPGTAERAGRIRLRRFS